MKKKNGKKKSVKVKDLQSKQSPKGGSTSGALKWTDITLKQG